MRFILTLTIIFSVPALAAGIKGRVSSVEACRSEKSMVWLSKNYQDFKKKELLMHTFVPEGGTFQFYLLAGEYLVVASNEKGCSAEQVVTIIDKDSFIQLELNEKKK